MMRTWSIVCAMLLALTAGGLSASGLSAAEPIQLFNGKNLDGWTMTVRGDADINDVWKVEDGILITPGRPIGYIRTKEKFTNYKIIVEWRFPGGDVPPGNSGVLLRLHGPDKVWPKSIEAQLMHLNAGDIWNIDNFKMTVAEDRTEGRRTKKAAGTEKPLGEWNRYEITINGGDLEIKVNGELANTATDCEEIAGYIGLQSEGAVIHFRKVELHPLD